MFRIDTPELPEREYVLEKPAFVNGGGWAVAGTRVKRAFVPGCSVLVGAGSIYRIIPCAEALAMRAIEASLGAELRTIDLSGEVKQIEPADDPLGGTEPIPF